MTMTLPPLWDQRELLEVVDRFDPDTRFTAWRPQILVPPTFKPVAADRPPAVFVVVNQKGGAGKTTTTMELAAAWAARGFRVRIIDADPQHASISSWLEVLHPDDLPSDQVCNLLDVYTERATLDQATWPTRYEGLYLVPSGQDLARVEWDPKITGAEQALRWAIEEAQDPMDITIIDCGPSLGKLSISGLVAAKHVLIPALASALDAMGMESLSEAIERVQSPRVNPDLRVRAAVITQWDKTLLSRGLALQIAEDWPEAVVTVARRAVRSAEAPAAHGPIREYDPRSTTASDYDQLAEILIPSIPTPRSAA